MAEMARSLFKDIFSREDSFVDVYKACSGNQLSAESIKSFNIEPQRMDSLLPTAVSFLTNDNRLIIIAEQNTPNPNIPMRAALYYADLLQQWLDDPANMGADAPMPELYIVHNGEPPCGVGALSVGNDFFQTKAELSDVSFGKLADRDTASPLAGYAFFHHRYGEKKAEGKSGAHAFDYAVQQCEDAGYLRGVVDRADFVATYKQTFSNDGDTAPPDKTKGRALGGKESVIERIKEDRQGKQQINKHKKKSKKTSKSGPEL